MRYLIDVEYLFLTLLEGLTSLINIVEMPEDMICKFVKQYPDNTDNILYYPPELDPDDILAYEDIYRYGYELFRNSVINIFGNTRINYIRVIDEKYLMVENNY